MAGLFDACEPPPDPGPYRMARRTDPPSSAAAAERHERTGAAARHRDVVLRLVRANPGATGPELHAAQVDSDLEYHEIYRRANDLRQVGLIAQGEPRACSIKRERLVTWWPAGSDRHG